MKISQEGLKELSQREGIRTHAYRDTRGIWTIGIGHTSMAGPPDVHEGLVLGADECLSLFSKDILQYEETINKAIKAPLKQNQFDALVSICYNIGSGNFTNSSLARDINNGRGPDTIDEDIMKWNKPKEIVARRESELHEYDA